MSNFFRGNLKLEQIEAALILLFFAASIGAVLLTALMLRIYPSSNKSGLPGIVQVQVQFQVHVQVSITGQQDLLEQLLPRQSVTRTR